MEWETHLSEADNTECVVGVRPDNCDEIAIVGPVGAYCARARAICGLTELFIASGAEEKLTSAMLTVQVSEPQVVFEDDELLVVDKPGGLVCHSASRPEHPTLVAWLREYLSQTTTVPGDGTPHLNPLPQGERRNPSQSPRPDGGEAGPVTTGTGKGKTRCTIVPRLINRLDRETSGLVIVAKNERAARSLGKQVLRREIQKEYVAICWGEFAEDSGVVDQPIGLTKDSAVYTKRVVDEALGKPCVTEFAVERRLKDSKFSSRGFTVVRLQPRTGRAHQLRVHMAWLGHPIVGDKVYGPDETLYLQFIKEGVTEEMLKRLLLPRHALHAERVAFRHPHTGLSCEFRAELPADMREFLAERGPVAPTQSRGSHE